jgi:glycosyltransferase involved in cell wall biosynthesis
VKQKAAILSHILPPSPSGQATVLYRLLSTWPADKYCLISRDNYDDIRNHTSATERLPARYYHLKPILTLPILTLFKLCRLSAFVTVLWEIYGRARQLKEIIQKENCRLLIGCTGDLYDLPSGYLAARWARVPFLSYIFDDYIYQWTGLYRTIARHLEPAILKGSRVVIVTNEHMQKEYMRRYGLRSAIIHNPCPLPDLADLDRAEKVLNTDGINIVYAGAVYHAHYDAFRNLIAAIHRLERDDIRLHIYTAQPESELRQEGISGPMVVYHPHISALEVPKVLRQADILFLPLAFNSPIPELIGTSAPGKTAEYLSVGRPILAHAPQNSFVSWLIRHNRCGVVVDRNTPKILSEQIEKLLTDDALKTKITKRARRMAERYFSIDEVAKSFYELVATVQ